MAFLKVIVRFQQDSLIYKVHLIHEALHVVKVFCELHNSFHPYRQLIILIRLITICNDICTAPAPELPRVRLKQHAQLLFRLKRELLKYQLLIYWGALLTDCHGSVGQTWESETESWFLDHLLGWARSGGRDSARAAKGMVLKDMVMLSALFDVQRCA